MHRLVASIIAVLIATPALALVGGAREARQDEGVRHAVMIVSSRGSSCTGTALARNVVLTAAHCVVPGADYKLVEFDSARRPTLKDIAQIVRHPEFSMAALNNQRATADIALLRTAEPLPPRIAPALLSTAPAPTKTGERFLVTGFGVTTRGDGKSGGTLRAAELVSTGRPGSLQLRLMDPATSNTRPGIGACDGDSGAPVFVRDNGALAVIGVVSWSNAPTSEGCGGLTGITPLARYRAWVVETARKLGAP
jgi:secreted trypsin-like serine protease